MSRCAVGFITLVLTFVGITVVAADKTKRQDDEAKRSDPATISFVVAKTAEGSVVQISVGDWVLTAPKLMMNSKSGKDNVEITAQDEKVVLKSSKSGNVTGAKEITLSLQAPTKTFP